MKCEVEKIMCDVDGAMVKGYLVRMKGTREIVWSSEKRLPKKLQAEIIVDFINGFKC